jgi:hypothetical protein
VRSRRARVLFGQGRARADHDRPRHRGDKSGRNDICARDVLDRGSHPGKTCARSQRPRHHPGRRRREGASWARMNGEILAFARSRLDVREQVRKSVRLHRREAVVEDRYFAVIPSSCGLSTSGRVNQGCARASWPRGAAGPVRKANWLGADPIPACADPSVEPGFVQRTTEARIAFTAARQRFLDRAGTSRGM